MIGVSVVYYRKEEMKTACKTVKSSEADQVFDNHSHKEGHVQLCSN